MESILQHLGFPIAVAIVLIGVGIARRIGSDESIELDALRKENARLATELRKYQQADKPGAKEPDTAQRFRNFGRYDLIITSLQECMFCFGREFVLWRQM
nr:hypothetical protein [Candidatus Melainabacteria bacterium]